MRLLTTTNRLIRNSFSSIHRIPSLLPSLSSSPSSFSLSSLSIKKSTSFLETPNTFFEPTIKLADKITMVRDKKTAQSVLSILKSDKDVVWACDTEVADIDVTTQSPVGNGLVTCLSIYGGPSVDFGRGNGGVLWIENIDEADGIAMEFKDWFESKEYKKVWHNYGFDRHVIYNLGIDCKGFAGDTMHMARLWDSSRDKISGGEGYSLESLSTELLQSDFFKKVSMKDLFGVPKKLKDGSDSKIKDIPSVRELQRDIRFRDKWIEYSARDAIATWHVYDNLRNRLQALPWVIDGKNVGNMMDYNNKYLLDFGELLTDMERNGIMVDTQIHLKQAEVRARKERAEMEKLFIEWASQYCPDAKYINPSSSAQIQQLLFGQYEDGIIVRKERVFKMDKDEIEFAEEQSKAFENNPYINCTSVELKNLLKQRGLKTSGKKSDLVTRLLEYDKKPTSSLFESMDLSTLQGICISRGFSSEGTKEQLIALLVEDDSYILQLQQANAEGKGQALNMKKIKKQKEITITSIGLDPLSFTPKGQPQVSASSLKKMAGQNVLGDEKDAVWGTAYESLGGGEKGKAACRAIGALAAIGQVDATITNFLVPLQALVDKNSRIHCSLNLNTETGRLSSRRPNLQNQPALEKDQYKIRDAFIAAPGNTLIVADYGQLELRVLAHVTSCESMIEAFRKGGCFHSRTAMGMYNYIRKAVDSGKVLLEWDYSKGQPNVPLVKDTYGSERRKAKTLNFSIAYGKTVHGLAQDWGITTEEAQETLDAWYRDRPEVKEWQEQTKAYAMSTGHVRTLMGRYRLLEDAKGPRGRAQGHALRAAINTPIQGSAADVVIMAMIKLWKNEVLAKLGWKLLLQIHDEVILEGPKESMPEAMIEVRNCMENPFDGFGLKPLKVHLDVDAKSADSWYKAK